MTSYLELLVITGAICMFISIASAWIIVGTRILNLEILKKKIPNIKSLTKAHVDYVIMSALLFVFYTLFRYFSITPAVPVVISICLGSLMNPFLFVIMAVKPKTQIKPLSIAGIFMYSGFILTSVGYLVSAWLVLSAVI